MSNSDKQRKETKSAEDEYNEVSGEFEKVAKRILIFKTDKNRKVPTDGEKILKYKTDIVTAYNAFIAFVARVYDSQAISTQEALQRDFDNVHKPKLLDCLKLFKLTAQLPKNFLPLDIDTVVEINTSKVQNISNHSLDIQSTSSATQSFEKSTSDTDQIVDSDEEQSFQSSKDQLKLNASITLDTAQLSPKQTPNNTDKPEASTMPQTKQEFLKMATGILNYKYDADPLRLESFLADVEIVEAMAEADQTEFCMKFVKAKLDQKALEYLPDEIKTLKDITDALRKGIKVDSSDVVEGKMIALRLHRGNYTEFTKKAEDLANEYRRSLIAEKISKEKATEMAIKKTIEMCRSNATFDTVKTVVSASTYEKPSEVLSKFVTQSDIARKEKREADNKQNLNKNSNGYRGKNKFGGRGGGNYRGQNGQNRDSHDQNGRGRSNGGRGGYRGGRGFNRSGQYSQPRAEQTIRLVAAQAPQQAQNNQPNTQGEALSEQFFRLSA